MENAFIQQIENGNVVTGADFLKLCMRSIYPVSAFASGLQLNQRLPDKLIVDSDFIAEYEKSAEEYSASMRRPASENAKIERSLIEAEISKLETGISNLRKVNDHCHRMRKEISAWSPPQEGKELKEFALGKLDLAFTSEKHIQELESILEDMRQHLQVEDHVLHKAFTNRMRTRYYALKKEYVLKIKSARKANAYMNSILNSLVQLNKRNKQEVQQS